jgi:hypothetical protein
VDADDLLDKHTAARLCEVCLRTFWSRVKEGAYPKPLPGWPARWKRSDLEAALAKDG